MNRISNIRGHLVRPRGRPVKITKRTVRAGARRVRRALKLKTRTKTKVSTKASRTMGDSGTESSYKIILRARGLLNKMEKQMLKTVYSTNAGNQFTSAVGKQGVTWYTCLYDPLDLNTMMGNAWNNSGVVKGQNTMEVYFKDGYSELAIQNSSNGVVKLIIYVLMARRDIYKNSSGDLGDPVNCWIRGDKDTNTGGTDTTTFLGARPTDSIIFNKFWKIKKVVYTELSPDQVHYQRVRYDINKRLNEEVAAMTSDSNMGIKGWTLNYLIVGYGQPIGDNASSSTVAATKFNVVHKRSYHYSYYAGQSSYLSNINNLVGTAAANIETREVTTTAPAVV